MNPPKPLNILVSGAAGFIGSHLAEFLASKKYKVTGIDCLTNFYSRKLKQLNVKAIQAKGIKFLKLDLASKKSFQSIKPNFDYIYHLAAQPGLADKVPFSGYLKNNVIATQNLIDFALTNKNLKCFIYISTSSVYGLRATQPETAPAQPASFYGVTKLAAEQLVMSQFRQGNLPACSIRPYSVYGPRERPEKLYTRLIKSILENKKLPLFKGSQNHSRSFTYVGDAVQGLYSVIKNTKSCLGEIINLGSNIERKTKHGIRIIENLLGKKAKFITQPSRPGDQLQTRAIITKAKQLLNYHPTTSLAAGLKKQVEWYLETFHN